MHTEDDYSKIVFVHKGACDRVFQNVIEENYREKYGNLFSWTDIDRFLYILMNNAGIDYEKAKNHFKDLVDYGLAYEGKGYKDKDIDVKKEDVEIDDKSVKKILENLFDKKIVNEKGDD